MYRYIVLAGRTAGLWVAQVVVKVETDEDNHNSKGRWRRRSAWRTYLALNTCLLCTLSYLFFWVYPPPALHDDHFSVFSAMSYSCLLVCVIQNIPFCGLILLCDNIEACVLLLLTLHMHVSTTIFWFAYHSMYLRPCTCLVSAYFVAWFQCFRMVLVSCTSGGTK